MTARRSLMIDPARCDGCGECRDACARTMAPSNARIEILQVGAQSVPALCQHCSDAPCATACMSGCRTRDPATGVVVTDYERCVGCWMCVMLCPFGAIERVPSDATAGPHGVAPKCDGCGDVGRAPCVEACKRGGIRVGDPNALAEERREQMAGRWSGGDAESRVRAATVAGRGER